MNSIDKSIFNGITLMYVEDDVMALDEIKFFLNKYIKNIIFAKDGVEGLELFKKHQPDMIITDIQMPRMNGLEMAREILKINPNIPIAMTTAYSDASYLMEAIELGIEKYILKPINLFDVISTVKKCLCLGFDGQKRYEDYIQFILDSTSTFMLIMNSDKIEYVNKNLLDIVVSDETKSFEETIDNYKNIFEFYDIKSEINCFDYAMKNPAKDITVRLKKDYNRVFSLKYKNFELMNKKIFIFVELNFQQLNEINSIVNDLMKALDKNSEVYSFYHEFVKISNLSKLKSSDGKIK